jgi:hypothetical protein
LLILAGGFNLAIAGSLFLFGIQNRNTPAAELLQDTKAALEQSGSRAKFTSDLAPEEMKSVFLRACFIVAPLWLIAGLVTVAAGFCFRGRKSYRLTVLGAVLVAIPFLSPVALCGLGEVVGIWALVVLLRPGVKAAFL